MRIPRSLISEASFEINPPETHFWRILSEICSVEAHLMKTKLPEVSSERPTRVAVFSQPPEKTWKAVALAYVQRYQSGPISPNALRST